MIYRLSISFFALSGLDLLDNLALIKKYQADYIDWIYQFQITSNSDGEGLERCGFRGSLSATHFLCKPDKENQENCEVKGSKSSHPLDTSHITMTYAAINSLLILEDNLERLNRKGILAGVKALQLSNGR